MDDHSALAAITRWPSRRRETSCEGELRLGELVRRLMSTSAEPRPEPRTRRNTTRRSMEPALPHPCLAAQADVRYGRPGNSECEHQYGNDGGESRLPGPESGQNRQARSMPGSAATLIGAVLRSDLALYEFYTRRSIVDESEIVLVSRN